GGGAAGPLVRPLDRGVGARHGGGELLAVEGLPGPVVVGAEGVGDAPVRHGAVRGGGGRLREAGDGLLVVERVGPQQAAVEPLLGLGGSGGHGPAVGAEVVVVVRGVHDALPGSGSVGPGRHAAPAGTIPTIAAYDHPRSRPGDAYSAVRSCGDSTLIMVLVQRIWRRVCGW